MARRSPRRQLTFRRLLGLDRSGPAAARDASRARRCSPWTIPNAIGYVRLALIPVFLVLALSSERRHATRRPRSLFAVIGWSDYLDGIAARVTGQYSPHGRAAGPARGPAAGDRRA